MLRNKVIFERIIDGRVCQCVFDNDLPSTIGKEFASQFISFIIHIEEAAVEAQAKKEEKPQEIEAKDANE